MSALHWAVRRSTGLAIFVGVAVVGMTLVHRGVRPASTFRTGNLIVDDTSTVNGLATFNSNVGLGGSTPPTYDTSAVNWIKNTTTTQLDQLIVDSESSVNKTSDLDSITIHNSGTFDATTGPRNAIGLRIVVDPTKSAGGNLLNNAGLTIDTNNGDTNQAIHVIHGITQLDEIVNTGPLSSSTMHSIGNFDVNTSKFTVDATTGDVEATGLVTMSNVVDSLWTKGRAFLGGTTKGDTVYISSGSVNFGFEDNVTDILHVNFLGYHGGFSQFRTLSIEDGQGDEIARFLGPSGHLRFIAEGRSAPALSASCTSGGGGSITGTDTDFTLVTGASSVACVVTFVSGWTVKPVCVISVEGGTTLPTWSVSPSAFTFTVNLSATTYDAHCFGTPGAT